MHQWVVLRRCWVEGLEPKPKIIDVQGRLGQSYTFWKNTSHAQGPILYCIQSGYKLPLQCAPTVCSQDNHRSAIEDAKFVTEAIQELVANRCTKKVSAEPFICSPLSVVVNSKGLVLNLKHLN